MTTSEDSVYANAIDECRNYSGRKVVDALGNVKWVFFSATNWEHATQNALAMRCHKLISHVDGKHHVVYQVPVEYMA